MDSNKHMEVCPNCGYEPKSNDYSSNLLASLTGHDVISGRFRCPKCKYYGIALIVDKKDLEKIDFKYNKNREDD
jgi:rubredoxin